MIRSQVRSALVSAPQYRLLAELRYQIRSFLHFSEEAARQSGLEPQQHQLLLAIKGIPEGSRPTIAFLAERLCVRHHTAVELANRSCAQGLVIRRPSLVDRREVLVEITAKGEQLLTELAASHLDELRRAGPRLAVALDSLLADVSPDDNGSRSE